MRAFSGDGGWRRVACRVLPVAVAGFVLCLPAACFAAAPGRVYELVSPVFKGGYGANAIVAAAADGESVAFLSSGAFSGAPANPFVDEYIARRGETEWASAPLMAPTTVLVRAQGDPLDFSPSLGLGLYSGFAGSNGGAANTGEEVLAMHRTDALDVPENFTVAGVLTAVGEHKGDKVEVRYEGASRDLSHIFFDSDAEAPLLPTAQPLKKGHQLYELVTGGAGAPVLRFVGLDDAGELIDRECEVTLGTVLGEASKFNAVSADGTRAFFTADANPAVKECDESIGTAPANPARLFVRIDGTNTLLLSTPTASECEASAPCHGAPPARAEFVGADESGSCAFFVTTQPLVSGDVDTGRDLYMARVGNGGEERGLGCAPGVTGGGAPEVSSLIQVSHDPNPGQAADVQGVTAVSRDGSYVYFVARGVLSAEANGSGQSAVLGADNLYVYERDARYPAGHLGFVADLCSGPEASGEAHDSECPATVVANSSESSDRILWSAGPFEQTAGEGRYLFFDSYGRLAPGDVDSARDLYRYDAATGSLVRVSHGEAGYDANGNNSAFGAVFNSEDHSGVAYLHAQLHTREVAEDGGRAVFVTSEPLSPRAVNGLANVYEWRAGPDGGEGEVSLLSSGDSNEGVSEVVMSESGRDVFFKTSQGLVPQDTDGEPDIYDARLGGGFPVAPAPTQPCSGDACQGPLSAPAPLLVPGSVAQAPGGNLAEAPPVAAVGKSTPHKSAKRKGKRARKPRRTRGKRAALATAGLRARSVGGGR